jgi:hypothetical protein
MHTKFTVYFDIVTTSHTLHAVFYDKKTRTPLAPEEKIEGLPKGATLISVPLGHQHNCYIIENSPDYLLKTLLQKEGFLSEKSALSMMLTMGEDPKTFTGSQRPDTPPSPKNTHPFNIPLEDGEEIQKVVPLKGGGYMIEIKRPYKPYEPEPQKPLSEFDKVRFKLQYRPLYPKTSPVQTELRVGIEVFDVEEDSWLDQDNADYDVTNLPSFITPDESMSYKVTCDETTAREALLALGWLESPELFTWYTPQEIEFGIVDPEEGVDPNSIWGGMCIFMSPITPHPVYGDICPFDDDLREECLEGEPNCFDGNEMENTFSVKPELTRQDVMDELLALGYTYNSKLDTF